MSDKYVGEGLSTADLPSGAATDAEVAAGYEPLDSDLTAIAALTTTPAGRALLDDASAAAQRETMGVVNGGVVPLTAAGLTAGSKYELVTTNGRQYLALRRWLTFGLTTRTIAAADSEAPGWTWDNRSKVSAADENTTTAGVCRITHDAVDSAWDTATFTAPNRTHTGLIGPSGIVVVARVKHTSTTNGHLAGITVYQSGSKARHNTLWVGKIGGNVLVENWNNTTGTTASLTASDVNTNGVWLMLEFLPSNTVRAFYSTANQASPPTSWTFLAATTSLLSSTGIAVKWGQIVLGDGSSYSADYLYYDDYAPPPTGNYTLYARQADYGAQGYDTANTEQQIITDYDLGSDAAVVTQAELRRVLADLVNRMPGDAATVTFTARQSTGTGGTTSGLTYAAASSMTITGTGRYFSLWVKMSSDGLQSGSLILPASIPYQ